MTVSVAVENETLKASVEGKLDSVTSSDLDSAIRNAMTQDVRSIELDLEKVEFISSKGLRVLVSLYRSLPSGELHLVNPNMMVREVLKLSGLLNVFKVETR